MKALLLTSLTVVFGCATTILAAEEISNKQAFTELVVGKKLVQGDTWVRILKDGEVEGKGPKAGDISGSWEWNGPYYCRDIVIEEVAMPRDCQVVTIEQGKVTFTHKEGNGVSVQWNIE